MAGDGDRRWGGKGGQEGYRYRYPYLSYPNPGRILRMLLYSRGILAVRAGLQYHFIMSLLIFCVDLSTFKKSGPRTHPPRNVVATTLTKFTSWLINKFTERFTTNEDVFGQQSSSWYTILVSGLKYDCCILAPNNELITEPSKPHASEYRILQTAYLT